ncbi:MAG TPA: zinc ribbon domain-containing protein [Roseiflexaceae bacterium]|nr:zinc ribbon domain-containing protein [Roseiflexaceae bacterium]
MMPITCPFCGKPAPAEARFCIACGMPLGSAEPNEQQRASAQTGSTIPLSHTRGTHQGGLHAQDGIPLVGLLFGALFLIGFAQHVAHGGLRGPAAWLTIFLLCGALVAERAWVNGAVWSGLRGMVLWGGLIGLLAIGHLFPWALLLLPIWLVIWLCARGRP